VKFNNQPAAPKVGVTLKESGTYTDFANINSGGITEDGSDGVNDVSYLILDCMDEMRLLQPSSNVQISSSTPDAFLKRACAIARKGWGQPAFYNTEAIVEELINAGKSAADAKLGGASGCVETGVFGMEAYILTGYFNLPKVLEVTLNNGVDPQTGVRIGLETGLAEGFNCYDELLSAYEKQINYFIDIKTTGSNIIESMYAKHLPVPFLSVVTDDCIAKGMDYNEGGARYNTSYIQGVGIGTVTDSLSVIKHAVFENGLLSMKRLMEAVGANFEGFDDVLSLVKGEDTKIDVLSFQGTDSLPGDNDSKQDRKSVPMSSPKYGNDSDYADDIMQTVFNYYHRAVTGRPNTRGGEYRINMLSTTCHVYFGEVCGAMPNGRLAKKPVSEGISPTQGADFRGPTTMLRSAAKMNHMLTGGTLLNMKLNPLMVKGDEGLNIMAAFVAAYFHMRGHHLQFNVITRKTLLAAQAEPEAYRDLIVRVAGYSDHFRNLSKALQYEIIDRTEHKV
jgi:formate C-acetyltransferase